MSRATKTRAARLAAKLSPDDTWDDAFRALDEATGWDLSAPDLDALTDLAVEARAGVSLSLPRRVCFLALARRGATIAELAAAFGGDTECVRLWGDDGPVVRRAA